VQLLLHDAPMIFIVNYTVKNLNLTPRITEVRTGEDCKGLTFSPKMEQYCLLIALSFESEW